MEKILRVGDKVKYSYKQRQLKKEFINVDVNAELRKANYDNGLIKKFYSNKFKTIKGISVIKKIDNYFSKLKPNLIWYELENGEFVFNTDIEYIPHHHGFYKLLTEATSSDSILTRSGKLYYFGDLIMLEHVKSTRNVWVDDMFAKHVSQEDRKLVELEIRGFFGSVNNVNFGLGLNTAVEERKQLFEKMAELCRTAVIHD